MTVPFKRLSLVVSLAALCAAAPALGAQGAQGGGCGNCRRPGLTEAEQRRVEQVRRELERMVERARDRIDELRENPEYRDTETRAMRQVKIVLEQAEPASPDFPMQLARLQAIAAQEQLRFLEDQKLKGAIKDMARLYGELSMVRRPMVQRGWMGVTFSSDRTVGRDGRVTFTVEDYPKILSVQEDSPAEQAGVRSGDVLLALDGRDLVRQGPIPLTDILQPGRTVKLSVMRGGKKKELPLRVGVAPETRVFVRTMPGDAVVYDPAQLPPTALTPVAPRPPRVIERVRPAEAPPAFVFSGGDGFGTTFIGLSSLLGAQLLPLERDYRQVLDVEEGVMIVRVQPRSVAAESDLHGLDVVVRVDDEPVRSPEELRLAIDRARQGGADSVVVTIVREKKQRKVTLRW